MIKKAVSVPGKLFLLGEYAVLSGGPALLSAVDRRIHVRHKPEPTSYRILGAEFADPRSLPELVAKTLREQSGLEISPDFIDSLEVDVSEFYHQGQKLGIGSSAASTVALIKAMAPDLSVDRQFGLAFIAHKALQGGRGSGADVALSAYGGRIIFRGSQNGAELPQITPISLPFPVQIYAVWTGTPAHSVSFIDGVRRTRDRNPSAVDDIYQAIAESAEAGIQALVDQDSLRFLSALEEGDELMDRLGTLCDLPIITDTHRELRQLARASGFVTKPSGAGGGDFSLIAGPLGEELPATIKERFLVNLS